VGNVIYHNIKALHPKGSREKNYFQCRFGQTFAWHYDLNEAIARDLPYGPWDRYLMFYKFWINCHTCGIRDEVFEWIEPYARCTNRFKEFVSH
jgi:hypothetical protein